MAAVSVAEAARLVGRDRRTLYRDYIKAGRLTATTDATGKKTVDTAELERVFGPLGVVAATVASDSEPRQTATTKTVAATTESDNPDKAYEARISALETAITHRDEIIAAKEKHIESLDRAMLMLGHDRPRRRWWRWGKG